MQAITFELLPVTSLVKCHLLLGDLGDQMYHFIHLTLRLFSRNTIARTQT